MSSLGSIQGEDVAPLSLVEEVYTETAGFSHRLSVHRAVLGKMSIRETAQTLL